MPQTKSARVERITERFNTKSNQRRMPQPTAASVERTTERFDAKRKRGEALDEVYLCRADYRAVRHEELSGP